MAMLPDLVGRLRLDMSEMDRAQGEATRKGAAIGSALGSAVGNLAGGALAAAGQKVTEFVTGSVDAFARLQDATAASGVVFGKSFGDVERFSDGAAKAIGVSKAEALEASITFGTFGKQMQLTGAPLADFSNGMTTLAGDMASFRGTSPEEAIQAIGSAFKGEYDPIEKYGVIINAAAVKNKALEMGFKPINGELTTQQKMLATQKLIWEQTADAQGDFQRSGDSVANTQKRITAETENAQAALGEKLAPAYLVVLNAINQVINGITGFLEIVGRVAAAVWEWRDAIAAVGIVLGILGARIIAANVSMAAYLITQAAIKAATTAWTAVQWLLNAAMTANPIGIVIAVIAALVAGIIIAYNHSETFRRIVDGLWQGIKNFVADIPARWETFKTAVVNAFTAAKQWVEGFIADIVAFPGRVVAALGDFGQMLWDKIVGAWEYVKTGWNAANQFLVDTITTWIAGIVNALLNFGTSLWEKIGAGWEFIKTKWAEANTFLVQSITTWITNIVNGLIDFGVRALGGILQGWENVKTGWAQANQFLVTKASEFVTNTLNALVSFAQGLWDKIVGAWNALGPAIVQPINDVIGKAKQMATDIIGSLTALPGQMIQMGKDIINGLLQGLQELGPTVVSYLTNLIPEPVRKALNIASPSGIMDEIGQQTMQGLQQGLESWMPKIRSTLQTIIEIVNEVKSALRISSPSGVMIDMGDMTGQGFHTGLEAWIPKIQALLDKVTAMVAQANAQMKVLAEDGSKVNASFYDAVDVGNMKQADINALLAKGYKGDPTDKREILYAPGKNSKNTPITPTKAQLATANAPANMSKMIRAEDGSLVPASFYSGIKSAPNKLGTMTNLPGHSLYPADMFNAIKDAGVKLGKLVMAEDGTLVPASFYENVKAAPLKASKTVLAEDGSWVPASFYDKVAAPTGINLLKMANSLKDKIVGGPGGKWGVDVSQVGKTMSDVLYQMGFRGDPTDKREAMYAPSNFGQTIADAAQKAGIHIDARSFGTQLKPQDVADAIKWASKIGGLVSA